MASKQDLTQELHRLEAELESYGSAVSESQIWHKKARIEQIKKELAELDKPKNQLNAGTDMLKEKMANMDMQKVTPEQIAAKNAGRG
ncbi:MAG: hypothetical protein IKJ62_04720 [Alphaproteobacteria bacterium]|nr:hypothetical protein [Alphaproteobacteria bacterium]